MYSTKRILWRLLIATVVFSIIGSFWLSRAATITVTLGTSENEIGFSATEGGNPAQVVDVVETLRRPNAIPGTSYVEIDRDGSWSGYFYFPSSILNYILYSAILEIQAAHTTNVKPYVNNVYLSRVDSGEYGYFDIMPQTLSGPNQVRMDALPTGCPADVYICNGGLALSAKLVLEYEQKDTPPPPEEVPEPRTGDLVVAGILAIALIQYLRWRGFSIRSKR